MTDRLRLLGTDLDRTLLPNGPNPESPQARPLFRALCQDADLTLVYISGRDRELVQRAIYSYSLPQPDFVISDVGTNIYDLRAGDWQLLDTWHARIAMDWHGHDHGALCQLFSAVRELRLQEYRKQNTYKLSYYFSLQDDREELDARLSALLAAQGIEASLVWSVDDPAAIGLLDVLPRSADKFHALDYLQTLLDIPTASILFAGDSGNDLPLLISAIPSVLVANAMSYVRDQARDMAEIAGHADRLYCAQGGYRDMNGNYSAGILEAIDHFFPEQLAALDDPNHPRRS
jgi:HAD superfamily hydrolase (TIGR01484 family)